MWWRYHIFILLVGVPTCRIFSSSTFPTDNGVGDGGYKGGASLNDEQLIEQLVQQLQERNGKTNGGGEVVQQEVPGAASKKDKISFAVYANQNADGTNNEAGGGLNLEQQQKEAASDKDPAQTEAEGVSQQSPTVHAHAGKTAALSTHVDGDDSSGLLSSNDTKFAIFVGAGLAAGFIGIMVAGVCYYKFRRSAKAATDISYPAYGVTGPIKEKIPSPGDRKLAQSAQMYHYQHQKQQMIAMEKANGDMKHDASEDESEEDNVEGDYTVYECPGLAPTGEMEVKNPLFCGGEEVPPPPPPEYAEPHAPTDPQQHQGQQGQGEGRKSPSSPSSQSHRSQ